MPVIETSGLTKVYRTYRKERGLWGSIKGLVKRRYDETRAADQVSFNIEEGEFVGFLGPNGAGKTTVLKMLSGLLNPTAGEARVLGYVPWHRENAYLRRMTLLIGNRSQLQWDIPAADSLQVLKEIYGLSADRYRATLGELTELLSLGDRMKVEFAAGLIQSPEVAFLDEPTIGLDVSMQSRIRRFVAEYNHRSGATILLTSHYMDDVVALCRRVIVIHHGVLLYDGALADLAERIAPYKRISVTLTTASSARDLSSYGEVASRDEYHATLHVPRREAPE